MYVANEIAILWLWYLFYYIHRWIFQIYGSKKSWKLKIMPPILHGVQVWAENITNLQIQTFCYDGGEYISKKFDHFLSSIESPSRSLFLIPWTQWCGRKLTVLLLEVLEVWSHATRLDHASGKSRYIAFYLSNHLSSKPWIHVYLRSLD